MSEDGLTDADREEALWLESDKVCYSCGDPICYGDECVQLRLVYPAPHTGCVILLDALEEHGGYTAEPLHFCFSCWDTHLDDLKFELSQLFITKRRGPIAHPKECSFCHTPVGWGDYAGYALYGELDVSPRTKETTFIPGTNETIDTAEIICMECLAWMNDDLDENIWLHMWVPDGVEVTPNGKEGPERL